MQKLWVIAPCSAIFFQPLTPQGYCGKTFSLVPSKLQTTTVFAKAGRLYFTYTVLKNKKSQSSLEIYLLMWHNPVMGKAETCSCIFQP